MRAAHVPEAVKDRLGDDFNLDETVIVIMIKEKQTGFLEKELASCTVKKYDNLLLNAFAEAIEGDLFVTLRLTCPRDVQDWEFDAIFDHYETEIYDALAVDCTEAADCFNPTWALRFPYDEGSLETTVNRLLELHHQELEQVFDIIKDQEQEYSFDEA